MQRHRQTLDEIVAALSPIAVSWKDSHSECVINLLAKIPTKRSYRQSDLAAILDRDFDAGLTAIRLILDLSKDEFTMSLRHALGKGAVGASRYRADRDLLLAALEKMGAIDAIGTIANTKVSWKDLLVERLKSGRGSAIKGQSRGRQLEAFVEQRVAKVFESFDTRCRFTGANGTSTEKADFAIPSKHDPCVLIEVKAYGATGSKQTDILGDISRIGAEKRQDTSLLLVTDGVTWTARLNDLRKLVRMQNTGKITRIYTCSMQDEFEADLNQLRRDHGL